MSEIEIVAIRKDNGHHDNPYEAISHYKWVERDALGRVTNSSITDRLTVVGWVDGRLGHEVRAFVQQRSPRAYCFVNTNVHGTRFLQTRADDITRNNLLDLPEC